MIADINIKIAIKTFKNMDEKELHDAIDKALWVIEDFRDVIIYTFDAELPPPATPRSAFDE